jgi:hypothetical protein
LNFRTHRGPVGPKIQARPNGPREPAEVLKAAGSQQHLRNRCRPASHQPKPDHFGQGSCRGARLGESNHHLGGRAAFGPQKDALAVRESAGRPRRALPTNFGRLEPPLVAPQVATGDCRRDLGLARPALNSRECWRAARFGLRAAPFAPTSPGSPEVDGDCLLRS